MLILKKYYCPKCCKLKSRFELYKQVRPVAYDCYIKHFYCKQCFTEVELTESYIEKIFHEYDKDRTK